MKVSSSPNCVQTTSVIEIHSHFFLLTEKIKPVKMVSGSNKKNKKIRCQYISILKMTNTREKTVSRIQ